MWNNFLRRYWKYILSGFVVVLLVISAILRLLTPPQAIVPITDFVQTSITGDSTNFNSIVYTGPTLEVPTAFTIMTTTPSTIRESDIVSALITRFGLVRDPNFENQWSNQTYILIKEDFSQQYILLNQALAFTPAPSPANEEQVVSTATQLIENIFKLPLTAQTNTVRYYVSDGHYEEVSPLEAEVIAVPFAYSVDSVPLFFEKESDYPFMVYVDSESKLRRLTFYPQLLSFNPQGQAPSISLQQAVKNINNNQASVITAELENPVSLSLKNITSAQLTEVTLEYRQDPELNAAYPFYRFAGTARNSQGAEMHVQIITPAIETVGR